MSDKIPESFWSIVKARFKLMPDNLRIVIGGYGSLTKKDILKHLEKKDEIGKLLVRMQIEYLKILKEEAESYERGFDHEAGL
jgi:hypothetical protein